MNILYGFASGALGAGIMTILYNSIKHKGKSYGNFLAISFLVIWVWELMFMVLLPSPSDRPHPLFFILSVILPPAVASTTIVVKWNRRHR